MTVRLLEITSYAKQKGIRASSIYEAVRQGRIPPGPIVRIGRRLYINEKRADEWLDAGGELGGLFSGKAREYRARKAAGWIKELVPAYRAIADAVVAIRNRRKGEPSGREEGKQKRLDR